MSSSNSKPLSNIVVVIRSPRSQVARRQAIRDTWGGDLTKLGAEVLFSLAGPHTEDSLGLVGDSLKLPCLDSHSDLTNRMIWTFRWLLAERPGKALFSIDDDCYVVAHRLANMDLTADVLGHPNDAWYMSGGPGLLLSHRCVKHLDWFMGRDDCVIGALLHATKPAGFTEVSARGLFNPWREQPWPTRDNAVVIQHYIREPEEMRTLHASAI